MFKKWPEYNLVLAEDPNDALTKLEEREYMMMFSDINMPVMSGLDLLKLVKEKRPDLPVVMLTSETDIQNSITAFRYGAMDYLLKPPTVATVRGAIDKAVEYLEEEAKKAAGGIDMNDFKDMVENFSPEKMGLNESGSKNTEFSKLVNMLQEKLIHPGKVGRVHKRNVQSAKFVVLKSPDIPSILIEAAFISNPIEEKRLLSSKHRKKMSYAILSGLKGYFKDFAPEGTLLSQRKHTIEKGEMISTIAQRYQINPNLLREYNELKGDLVYVGQTIVIPRDSGT